MEKTIKARGSRYVRVDNTNNVRILNKYGVELTVDYNHVYYEDYRQYFRSPTNKTYFTKTPTRAHEISNVLVVLKEGYTYDFTKCTYALMCDEVYNGNYGQYMLCPYISPIKYTTMCPKSDEYPTPVPLPTTTFSPDKKDVSGLIIKVNNRVWSKCGTEHCIVRAQILDAFEPNKNRVLKAFGRSGIKGHYWLSDFNVGDVLDFTSYASPVWACGKRYNTTANGSSSPVDVSGMKIKILAKSGGSPYDFATLTFEVLSEQGA